MKNGLKDSRPINFKQTSETKAWNIIQDNIEKIYGFSEELIEIFKLSKEATKDDVLKFIDDKGYTFAKVLNILSVYFDLPVGSSYKDIVRAKSRKSKKEESK